jgi:hypothetical protein
MSEKALTELIRRILSELEALAAQRRASTPKVYIVALFDDRSVPSDPEAIRLSDDVFVKEGSIAVRATNMLPLLVERIAAGYFALSLIDSGEVLDEHRVRQLVREAVMPVLAKLALST